MQFLRFYVFISLKHSFWYLTGIYLEKSIKLIPFQFIYLFAINQKKNNQDLSLLMRPLFFICMMFKWDYLPFLENLTYFSAIACMLILLTTKKRYDIDFVFFNFKIWIWRVFFNQIKGFMNWIVTNLKCNKWCKNVANV